MSDEVALISKEDLADLEYLAALKRASQGQPLTPDQILSFLVNAKDDRERTRLNEKLCYDHSGWEELGNIFPKTFSWLRDLAKIENIYFISLDGLQRQEAILMTKAKSAATTPLTIENVQNPVVQPGAPGAPVQQVPQQKGKHFWNR